MAQQPGAQAPQATDVAQQFAQMMQALAQGQSQLQRAMAEAYTQQTAITRNIATSVEVRDRSELKGTPKPDKFSGHTGTWDSWYFKFKTWIETSHKNAGSAFSSLKSIKTQRPMRHLWKMIILKEPSLFQLRPDRL